MYPELLLVLLVMLASPGQAAVEDGAARHQSQHYNNVFFSDPPHMKGRPSTSFVMVKSVDGRAYQLSHSGHQVTYTGPGDSASVEAPPSCPPMSPKPAAMCPPGSEVDTCQGDGDCVGPGHAGHVALCCYNGCGANACLAASHVVPRSVVATTTDTCPVVETKTEQQCANATANCWSRGVPDVDCPDFGLCCFDGCVNTCYVAPEETEEEEEEDLEYDQTLADAIEEDYDDELDDELDEELDEELDDALDESLDEYGAPAAPVVNLDDLDTYGSPLANTIDTYGSPAADPLTRVRKYSQPSPLRAAQKARNQAKWRDLPQSAINPVRTLNQIFPTSETKSFTKSSPRLLHYPAKTFKMFKSGLHQFHPSPSISASTSSPSVISPSPFLVLRKEAKRTARRKKLFLSTDRNKVPTSDVFSALEKIWRRHFGVFSNF